MHRHRWSLVAAMGCAPNGSAPGGSGVEAADSGAAPVVQLDVVAATALTEHLGACLEVAPLTAWRWLCRDAEGVWLVDETAEAPTLLGQADALTGATVAGDPWVFLDGEPHLWDGAALAPLDLPAPVPLEGARHEGGRLWMWGLGRLFSLVDGALSEVSVDGVSTIYGFAATGPRLHLSVPERLTLRLDADGPVVESMGDAPVTALAAAGADELWLVEGGGLYRMQGAEAPVEVAAPGAPQALVGPGPWLQTDAGLHRLHSGAWQRFDLAPDALLAVDSAGRLLADHGGALQRHSAERAVVVVGLPDSLAVATPVTLLPTAPASLDDLSVWVDDLPLPVERAPWTVTLDPEDLAPGEHELRFFTRSALGDDLTAQPVWVGALPDATWADDIAPLHAQHCAACHGGATATDLSEPAGWQAHIDAIIDLVTVQEMPLGGPYLTDDEIVLIRAWKHGGFP